MDLVPLEDKAPLLGPGRAAGAAGPGPRPLADAEAVRRPKVGRHRIAACAKLGRREWLRAIDR
eukprot:COSAG02_NODE_1250_length_13626_cov_72.701929_2_plen_63_part_00